jgi:type IV secretory pathway VirB3-like protein
MKNIIKLNSAQIDILKYLALIIMILDHIYHIINPELLYLHIIGRLSYVIFAFILAYNYIFNTKDKLKYLKRLFIFGLISEPFFMYSFNAIHFNIFLTLSLGLSIIYISEKLKEKNDSFKQNLFLILSTIPFIFIGKYIDYNFLGIMLISVSYIFIKNQNILNFLVLLLVSFMLNFATKDDLSIALITGLAGASTYLVIYAISILKVKNILSNKWLFFISYPAHMLILKIISIYI